MDERRQETEIAVMERDIKHILKKIDDLCDKFEGRQRYWRNTILIVVIFVMGQFVVSIYGGLKLATQWGGINARVQHLEIQEQKGERFTKHDGDEVLRRLEMLEHYYNEIEMRLDKGGITR